MNTTVDGEFQRYAVESGAYIREHFFGPDPRLRKLVEHLSDDDLRNLPRGGHDYRKLYAAYKAATEQTGAPTVILAKTIKGWTLGPDVEGRNATHQIKKMTDEQLRDAARRGCTSTTRSPRRRSTATTRPTTGPPTDSPEYRYLMDRRRALDGPLPSRPRARSRRPLALPADEPFDEFAAGSGKQAVSTTMAFTRLLRNLCPRPRASAPGSCRSSPTRPARSAWTRCSRSSRSTPPQGQRYEPVDHDAAAVLHREPATARSSRRASPRPASMASAAPRPARRYATRGVPMVPFFIFYSMFGFQRVGDLIWAAADARARGFLLGATAGRTTLLGEGLQHQDGHSLRAGLDRARRARPTTRPSPTRWPPSSSDGIERMYRATARRRGRLLLPHPLQRELRDAGRCPTASSDGIVEGLYRWAAAPDGLDGRRPRSCSRARPTARPARPRPSWPSTTASAPSCGPPPRYKRLREEALAVERWNRLHPDEPAPHARTSPSCSATATGPIVAVTDFMKAVPDQIARWVPAGRASCRSAPTASAAATPARRCAASSRPTPPTSWSPCWPRSADAGERRARRSWPRPSSATASTPTSADPRTR